MRAVVGPVLILTGLAAQPLKMPKASEKADFEAPGWKAMGAHINEKVASQERFNVNHAPNARR